MPFHGLSWRATRTSAVSATAASSHPRRGVPDGRSTLAKAKTMTTANGSRPSWAS